MRVLAGRTRTRPLRLGQELESGEGNRSQQSVWVLSPVSSLYKDRLGERIGSLSGERGAPILAGMRFQQASYVVRP